MRMTSLNSMVDLLRDRASRRSRDGRAYTFLDAGEREGASLTWAQLERQSRAIGARVAATVAPGSRVLILLPP